MSRPFPLKIAAIAAAIMFASSGLAYVMRPTILMAEQRDKQDLKVLIPGQFGEWREESRPIAAVINPQQQEVLDTLYDQVLTRTYVNAKGMRVMLSVAYGSEQSEERQVHRPELCYPAQGFQVQKGELVTLRTEYGDIPAKRLLTSLGRRHEPLTYWLTIGDRAVHPGIDKKLEQAKFGLRRQIPDGLIFRVSSIDRNETAAFAIQDNFIEQLLGSLTPAARTRIAGLPH